jgi:hypothetical protein
MGNRQWAVGSREWEWEWGSRQPKLAAEGFADGQPAYCLLPTAYCLLPTAYCPTLPYFPVSRFSIS